MLKEMEAEQAQITNVQLSADEIDSILRALRHYSAYLKSQAREHSRFDDLVARLEGVTGRKPDSR